MAQHSELHDHLDSVLFHETTILARLDEIAGEITETYRGKNLTVLAILHGGLIIVADLLRRIQLPLKIECVSVESYHGGVESSGEVRFKVDRMPDFSGEHVLVIDDILDSGRTLDAIVRRLNEECSPESVRVGVLLDKKVPRAVEIVPDYVGFGIDDLFVVGYGLDYQGRYRNLPLIGTLKDEHILPEHCA